MAVIRSTEWTDTNTGERHFERECHPKAPRILQGGHGVEVPLGTTDADLERAGWEQRGNGWVCPLHVLAETKGEP